MTRELLIGCGSSREKIIFIDGHDKWSELTTLDLDVTHSPDVIHDLGQLPLPFPDESFDEIHAYEVLEHVGQQGDFRFFFDQFSDFWRILKPGGYLCGTCPRHTSIWAWGDPGHTRVIQPQSLNFLSQEFYIQVGKTPATDYRPWYKADFDFAFLNEADEHRFMFALRAVKPSRIAI
jgi:SAM-dependent methyltransferase